ncbi:MAG: helix-turn-helix transcriptional regulator, partial [Rhizobiales bacterium]|nr:helix-turn-helix transcriptional regulator [Hyphomicrobiales bacterium]
MPRIPNEIDGYIARRIRQLRILGGFSQKKAAEYLNVTFQQFQKYEAGSNRVSVGKLYLIAEFLDVSLCDLYPPSARESDI